ncbi:MAG: hypothetical protein KJ914_04180 [Gammaproteobacteria bacterium]|nr:hypothetical protein [Gammaproteobacteria bacterium]MBU1723007.1 hypothetical protein [Gammaproteobacteria bacterium]MBU2003808.1 hypothetical protein [Gammaproteobacteria bacterium]
MKKPTFSDETRATGIHSTIFSDGMVVNAGDLDTAMMYPLEVIQVLIRAYFGCGIVCGLDLNKEPENAKETFCVTIAPGVALDCNGFPLQLKDGIKLNLKPDPCAEVKYPLCVCIAISRTNSPTAPRENGCDDSNGNAKPSYARKAELVRIKAFDANDLKDKCSDLAKNLCSACKEPGCGGEVSRDNPKHCKEIHECMTTCPESCCGESWVLIGCVTLEDCGISKDGIDTSCRKYVKPVDCLCQPKVEHRKDYPAGLDTKNRKPAAANKT